jgi:hypothetical protein
MNNYFPENGSVVIVDDQIKDALPLMNALSKLDIPFKYFTGKLEELPETPLNNVRIVFLDIELEGMEGVQNDTTKLSTLANVVSKIISNSSSPWGIIAWTKNEVLVKDIVNELNRYTKNKLTPIFTLCIEKSECQDNGVFKVEKIIERLNGTTNNLGALKYLLFWQNLINKASFQLVHEIASVYSFDSDWNNKMAQIFELLAEAYAGKQAVNDEDERKFSMMVFNHLLSDIVEQNILNQQESKEMMQNSNSVQLSNANEIKGELNRRILISIEENNNPVPGNIYCKDNQILEMDKQTLIREIFNGNINTFPNNNNLIDQCRLIFLEVSPFCDYAQRKWKTCRLLPGLMWPGEYENNIKKADYIYKTPLFMVNNQLCYFVFDIRYLTSIPVNLLENKKSTMRLRKELLNDIQTKIAGHINRLGVTSL